MALLCRHPAGEVQRASTLEANELRSSTRSILNPAQTPAQGRSNRRPAKSSRTLAALSGTRTANVRVSASTSMANTKKLQHAFSRAARSAASNRARSDEANRSRSRAPSFVTAVTDSARNVRHSSTRVSAWPASSEHAIGIFTASSCPDHAGSAHANSGAGDGAHRKTEAVGAPVPVDVSPTPWPRGVSPTPPWRG